MIDFENTIFETNVNLQEEVIDILAEIRNEISDLTRAIVAAADVISDAICN